MSLISFVCPKDCGDPSFPSLWLSCWQGVAEAIPRVWGTSVQKALGVFVGGLGEEMDDNVLHAALFLLRYHRHSLLLDYGTVVSFWCLSGSAA